jgi:hypothetical protein
MQEQYDPTNQDTIPPPGTVVGASQQQTKSNKTGWILLIVGLGCLGVLVLVAVVGIAVAIWLPRSVSSSRMVYSPPRGRAVPVSAGSMPSFFRSVEYIGSPKGDRISFEMQFCLEVVTKQTTHASNVRNPSELEAKVIFADDGTSGTATVDLSSLDRSRKGTMHLSFELDDTGQNWEFTLKKMEGP